MRCFYLAGVCAILMFCSIRSVAKRLTATRMFARVGLFAGMRSEVSFQVFQP